MGIDEFTRTNIKIKQPTYEKLSEEKRENETWDGFLERLLENTRKETDVAIKQEMREVMTDFGFEATETAQNDKSTVEDLADSSGAEESGTIDSEVAREAEKLLEKMQDSGSDDSGAEESEMAQIDKSEVEALIKNMGDSE